MKSIFILALYLALNNPSFAQTDCKALHKGSFKLTAPEAGTTIISRTDSVQIEENADLGVKMVFDIKWINECTYELRPKEVLKGPALTANKSDVLTVKIKEIKPKSYVIEISANFSDLVLVKEVEIL